MTSTLVWKQRGNTYLYIPRKYPGIEYIVKSTAAKASLHSDVILTPQQLHEWACKDVHGVMPPFFYYLTECGQKMEHRCYSPYHTSRSIPCWHKLFKMFTVSKGNSEYHSLQWWPWNQQGTLPLSILHCSDGLSSAATPNNKITDIVTMISTIKFHLLFEREKYINLHSWNYHIPRTIFFSLLLNRPGVFFIEMACRVHWSL
jgi:hypothetical protein